MHNILVKKYSLSERMYMFVIYFSVAVGIDPECLSNLEGEQDDQYFTSSRVKNRIELPFERCNLQNPNTKYSSSRLGRYLAP